MSSRWIAGYAAQGETEIADAMRMRRLAESDPDPWARSLPVHFTASALVVHPESARVLLRWLTVPEAQALVGDNNVRYTLDRVAKLFS